MPLITDVFGEAPFRATELTNTFNLIIPRPTLLGRLGQDLFRRVPSLTGTVAAYQIGRNQRLISTSPLGAPPERLEQTGGRMRRFGTHRIAKASTLQAISLANILQQPLFEAVRGIQEEVARRATLIRDDIELTLEFHRLGAVLCKNYDADGTTILHDWYDEWGITPPDSFFMELNDASTELRIKARQIINATKDASRGSWVDGVSQVHALCGEEFFTSLITHPKVTKAYEGYQAAAELLNKLPDQFNFGGIIWHDYRSALDPRFGIAPDTARTFPVGAGDVFQHVMGPAEFGPYIHQAGQETITIQFGDRDRQAWNTVETYSYPLMMNMRPEMCRTIKLGDGPEPGPIQGLVI